MKRSIVGAALAALTGAAHPTLAAEPNFAAADVIAGVATDRARCKGADRIWVEIGGSGDCLRFYGDARAGQNGTRPIVYLEGDVVLGGNRFDNNVAIWSGYAMLSPTMLQAEAEHVSAAVGRPFINLARPGVFGSSGDHLQRRREREVALVDAALGQIKQRFAWNRIDLAGFSGGGHLVAALLARRSDIGCAVIASGNVAVRRRLNELGRTVDFTGYTDSVDPIDVVTDIARHPPERIILLTDTDDRVVSATSQTAYVEALRRAELPVVHRHVTAPDPRRHNLRSAALLAAAGCTSSS